MNKVKHTPGPWTDYEFCGDWFVSNSTDDSGPMLRVGSWHAAREANARLIAAAPDILELHKENARILCYLCDELQGIVEAGKLGALSKCRDRCLSAIAKATGDTQ